MRFPITIFQAIATTDKSEAIYGALIWLGILVVVVIIGGFIMYLARKQIDPDESDSAEGFTLHDLRQLHAAGELSDEEYEHARAAIIQQVRSATRGEQADNDDNESQHPVRGT